DTDDEPVRAVEPRALVTVVERAADERAIEIDDSAVRDRQHVAEVAPDVIVARRDRMAISERHGVDEAEPCLVERLPGVPRYVERIRRLRIHGGVFSCYAARVVRNGLIRKVERRQEFALVAQV